MCYPPSFNNTDGPVRYQKLYCKSFTQHAVFVLALPYYYARPSSQHGWFPCADQFSFCESTCGNGRVEFWEQCDGVDWMMYCGAFQENWWWFEWPEETRTNLIRCNNNCQYDFTECHQFL